LGDGARRCSYLVATEILRSDAKKDRTKALEYFIQVRGDRPGKVALAASTATWLWLHASDPLLCGSAALNAIVSTTSTRSWASFLP
jgi:hypothetical protein